jgi:hypothetical protein
MNKWNKWYDSLPEHTKQYLKGQPLWHDKDVAFFCSIAMAVGFFFGCLVR